MTNIFEDDFAFLGDDDSGTGNRKENSISEYQSFTDLQHSKGKAVSAIHWLPHRKASAEVVRLRLDQALPAADALQTVICTCQVLQLMSVRLAEA